jgi:hypothetical protein
MNLFRGLRSPMTCIVLGGLCLSGAVATSWDRKQNRRARPAWSGDAMDRLVTGIDAGPDIFDIPKIENIAIDGDLSNWGNNGFKLQLLANDRGAFKARADFHANCQLAWDQRGLLIACEVRDITPHEADDNDQLATGDSVEFFVSAGTGSVDRYALVISPGISSDHPEPRHKFVGPFDSGDLRKPGQLVVEYRRARQKLAYTLEVLLPWSNLNFQPGIGAEMNLQIFVTTTDQLARPFTAIWFPHADTLQNPQSMHRIRLAEIPSAPCEMIAVPTVTQDLSETHILIVGDQSLCGRPAEAGVNGKVAWRGQLEPAMGQAIAKVVIRNTDPPQPRSCIVCVAGQRLLHVQLPDLTQLRALSNSKELH